MRVKLNVLREAVEGKRVIMIDDSIVRGTTSGHIVKMLKDAGATEVHVRISSPPFLFPCYFGADVPSCDQLIAHDHTVTQICELIGADSLGYLDGERLPELIEGETGYCDACFTGRYPVAIPESFGRDKFMEGFKPRNLAKPLHFDDDAVVEKYDDRSWEEEHGEA